MDNLRTSHGQNRATYEINSARKPLFTMRSEIVPYAREDKDVGFDCYLR
jgi:hypothetical protein